MFVTCLRLMSLPSVLQIDSQRVDAQWQATPSWTEVGGLNMLGGTKLSLPANPSRIPGKKLASRGRWAPSPIMTHRNTSSSTSSRAWTSSCTQLEGSASFWESAPITSQDSVCELSSRRQLCINSSMSPRAASSSIRGRVTFIEVLCWNLWRTAFTW